ncbi:hypothetical protein HYU96_03330 [Candidatus Daviesbacteria bacterium]|nr:hypothetical protein [Candidatus Daviesbacteria bacterium]
MSKKQQAQKNLELSVSLADFIAKHPKLSKIVISGASVVPFSMSDEKLNKENDKLVEELLEEGKKVVKAQETKNHITPWQFSQVSV